jgi:beta-barrel assembly-enhancing protease
MSLKMRAERNAPKSAPKSASNFWYTLLPVSCHDGSLISLFLFEGFLVKTPVLMLCVTLSGCSLIQRQNSEKAVASVLVSDSQESALGLQVHEELKTQNTKFLNNAKVEAFINNLAQKLMPQAAADRQLEWMWFIIDDPKMVNAFATPGGRIYVYTGLILAARNEAEIVGVLGHEIGHVVARHSARQLVAAKGLETVAAMALGKDSSDVAQLAAGLAGKGAMLAYGRDMELESDTYGVRYANGAGYNPKALADFFETLKAKKGVAPEFMTWFSTHPSDDSRIAKINKLIAVNGYNATNMGGPTLAEIKRELGAK